MIVVALGLWGCGTADPPNPPAAVEESPRADLRDLGWVSEIVLDPAAYRALVAQAPDGWEAMRTHDGRAEVAFGDDQPLGQARASFALVVLYEDLARATGVAVERLFTRWDTLKGLPAGDAPVVAALAGWCSGGESAGAWASRVPDGPGKAVAAAVALDRPPFAVSSADVYGRRMRIHNEARIKMDPAPLLVAARIPMVAAPRPPPTPPRPSTKAPPPPTFDPELWDPCVYRSLADVWTDRLARATGGTGWRSATAFASDKAGLGGTVFAAWPTPADLRAGLQTAEHAGLVGAQSPLLRQLGVGSVAFSSDDPESALAEVRTLDAALAAWSKKLEDQATDDGRAVLREVDPIRRFRQEWLLARARLALRAGHQRRALALVESARDTSHPEIGVHNGPAVFALLAETQLRLGRSSEALASIAILERAHPEVRGLAETVADLVVAESVPATSPPKN
jgi:hypothetical protein